MMNSKIIEALNWRYATKQFDTSKKINESDLDELLEVLRLTPSSFGLQPWKFIVVENKELRNKILPNAWNQTQITDASHLIVLCAKTDVSEEYIAEFIKETAKTRNIPVDSIKGYQDMMVGFRKGLSKEQISEWTKKQAYIALGMLLQSAAMKKIDSCPMEGFNPKAVNEILNLDKEGLTSVVLCPLGYRSENDKTAHYKKVRFSKEKIIEKR